MPYVPDLEHFFVFHSLNVLKTPFYHFFFLHLRHFLGLRQISNYRSNNYRHFDIDS
jgi:hypothetical protein